MTTTDEGPTQWKDTDGAQPVFILAACIRTNYVPSKPTSPHLFKHASFRHWKRGDRR